MHRHDHLHSMNTDMIFIAKYAQTNAINIKSTFYSHGTISHLYGHFESHAYANKWHHLHGLPKSFAAEIHYSYYCMYSGKSV